MKRAPEQADHIPPQNLEAEEAVLGAMMVTEGAIAPVIVDVCLQDEDFYRDRHRAIFGAIKALYERSEPIDALTVTELLTQRGELESAGGKAAVSTLASTVPSPGNARHYAQIVKQNALLRQLLTVGQAVVQSVHEREGEPDELVARAREEVDRVGMNGDGPTRPLRFVPWAEIRASAPPEPSWVVEGYVARGTVTLLAGKPKSGKSTLACAIAEAVDAGAPAFLDRSVAEGAVVYLSEEGAGTFVQKLPRSVRSVALTRDAAWPKPTWQELIAAAVDEAIRLGAVLLVIDALAFWATFREGGEKDAGAAQATMDALAAATTAGLAVLLVHHQRKGGGEDGDAVRGSGAIFGAVDVLLELERLGEDAPPGHRRLVAVGRWPQTPPVLVIDRDAARGAWRVVGQVASRQDAAALGMRERILAAMPQAPARVSEAELVELVGVDKRRVSGPLRELVTGRLVKRSGAGKRGDPYRYEKVPQKVPPTAAELLAEKVPSPEGRAPSANRAHLSSRHNRHLSLASHALTA